MTPIQDLLSRIRWDREYGRGQFRIGYWDRVAGEVLYVDLSELAQDGDNSNLLNRVDEDGGCHEIPLHRIREVWHNGRLIWQRGS